MNKKYLLLFLFISFPFTVFAASFERDLYFGMRNDADVRVLQQFLTEQKLYTEEITGNFFAITKEAVKRFQEKEKIIPAAGYFGPKTRIAANRIGGGTLTGDRAATIALLTAKIQELRERLKEFQNKLAEEQAQARFSVELNVNDVNALTASPTTTLRVAWKAQGFTPGAGYCEFGGYPPGSALATNGGNVALEGEETISYASVVETKTIKLAVTCYNDLPNVTGALRLSASDSVDIAINVPAAVVTPPPVTVTGVKLSGESTTTFPVAAVLTAPFKIGDIIIRNDTREPLLFSQLVFDIYDAMNSTLNRGRKITLFLRQGTTTSDTLISKTDFTFNTSPPPTLDGVHRYQLNTEYPILFAAGETKSIGFWIENLEYVVNGTLKFALYDIQTSRTVNRIGGFSFLLTQ